MSTLKEFTSTLIFGIGILLLAAGCGHDVHKVPSVDENTPDKLVVTENIGLECDKPFTLTINSATELNVTLGVEGNETVTYSEEDTQGGLELQYTIISECPPKVDTDIPLALTPVPPKRGKCPTGYTLNECGTMCMPPKGCPQPKPQCEAQEEE